MHINTTEKDSINKVYVYDGTWVSMVMRMMLNSIFDIFVGVLFAEAPNGGRVQISVTYDSDEDNAGGYDNKCFEVNSGLEEDEGGITFTARSSGKR